jgi:hypothetical protein
LGAFFILKRFFVFQSQNCTFEIQYSPCKYFFKMKEVFKISFFLLLIFGVGVKGNAQTYTFDASRPGCNGLWGTVACWEKVNNDSPPGCPSGISEIPNLTGSTGCRVFVTITDDVTFPGNVTLGGTLAEIEVQNGAVFTCRILPVDYTQFEVVQSPNSASTLLRWTTAKEENNEYFEVERSLAGIQDFKVIGQVPGMGWTDAPSEYTFEDRSLPLAGGDVFYRLRQVDFDGKYSLSKVIKVRVQGVNSTRGIWRVHPNPVAGESPKLSLVEATAYTDGPIQIRLIHVSSVTQKADLQGIDQLNESFPSLFAKMPNGLILLEISWGNQVEQIKIMKK